MLKQSIALGALVVSLINAAPTSATPTTTPIEFYTAGELVDLGALPALVSEVAAANVAVIKADETFAFCSQPGFTTYAGYNATINVIVICTNNAPPSRIATSFTHEAVHLVQDCKAGLQNADLNTSGALTVRNIWDHLLTEEKRENIKRSYDPSNWDVETEAFFFQDYPEKVAGAVNNFCFT